MKTKNNNMKIMKTESTANEQERKEAKYKPITPSYSTMSPKT